MADEADGYWTRTTSPDGAHVWIVDAHELRMSHWVLGGALWRRAPDDKRLFAAPAGWSFEERVWRSNDLLELRGRRYPGVLPPIALTLDVRGEQGTIDAPDLPGSPPVPRGPQPLAAIERWLAAVPPGRR